MCPELKIGLFVIYYRMINYCIFGILEKHLYLTVSMGQGSECDLTGYFCLRSLKAVIQVSAWDIVISILYCDKIYFRAHFLANQQVLGLLCYCPSLPQFLARPHGHLHGTAHTWKLTSFRMCLMKATVLL